MRQRIADNFLEQVLPLRVLAAHQQIKPSHSLVVLVVHADLYQTGLGPKAIVYLRRHPPRPIHFLAAQATLGILEHPALPQYFWCVLRTEPGHDHRSCASFIARLGPSATEAIHSLLPKDTHQFSPANLTQHVLC